MSKTPRRKTAARKRSAGQNKARTSVTDETKRRLQIVLAVAVLAGLPFVLGKYFEFNSPGAFDSGAYVYSAQHVLSGARIGYDERPSAQPGTLLVNMLGVKLFGFSERGSEVLQMLLQAAALALMFVTVRRLYGTLAGVVSVTVASVYLSAPLIAKFGNVKEQFMIGFMIVGICCFVFYQFRDKWWWAMLAGAALVAGPMFKQTGMSAIGATGLFVLPAGTCCCWQPVRLRFLSRSSCGTQACERRLATGPTGFFSSRSRRRSVRTRDRPTRLPRHGQRRR